VLRISASAPGPAQEGGAGGHGEPEFSNKNNGNWFGMVLAALQHNRANGGRSRGVLACALLKKDAKSNPRERGDVRRLQS